MSKFVSPPQHIEDELLDILRRRYSELEDNENVFRSVSYNSGSSAQARYGAEVTYHDSHGSSIALFEYVENREKLTYYWYCRRDWRD